MARDGKNKFYRQMNLSKEVLKLIKFYNQVWKREAYNSENVIYTSSGKTYTATELKDSNVTT